MPATTFQVCARQSGRRRGITLIELLIVMVIISIVTAASIPMLTTGSDQRRVREAARLVSSYISAAKSRAIETGRPAGVMIQRYAGQNYSMTLVGVEMPPPYAGDTTTSTATVSQEKLTATNASPIYPTGTYGTITGLGSDVGWAGLVRPGDLIQFGYQGRWYLLYGPTSPLDVLNGVATLSTAPITAAPIPPPPSPASPGGPGPWYLVAADGSGALPPGTFNPATTNGATTQVSYQILRQPVKSAAQPLQMPGDTVIDLIQSGIGLNYTFLTVPYASGPPLYPNPMLMFGPTGSVGFAYYDNNPPQHLTSTLYLLIGRREGMQDLGGASTAFNINHHSCMWVAVGPESGSVVTAENMAGTTNPRQFAQQASSIGGR